MQVDETGPVLSALKDEIGSESCVRAAKGPIDPSYNGRNPAVDEVRKFIAQLTRSVALRIWVDSMVRPAV